MECKACGRAIPDDALLCPYCGQGVFVALPSPRPRERLVHSLERRRSRVLLAYLFLMCCACCLLAAVALFAVYSPSMADAWGRLRERITTLNPFATFGVLQQQIASEWAGTADADVREIWWDVGPAGATLRLDLCSGSGEG